MNQKIGPQALYAFVTFSSTAEAQAALQQLNGYEMRKFIHSLCLLSTATQVLFDASAFPHPYCVRLTAVAYRISAVSRR